LAKPRKKRVVGRMEDGENNGVGDSNHKDIISTPAAAPSLAEEEAILKKKYGGLMPKKPPLISKDHERAFFDSADWALGKGGEPPGHKPRSMIEALRPKLQPTPHQSLPSRRSSLLPADGEVEGEPEEAAASDVADVTVD
jgi:hypothetical protein